MLDGKSIELASKIAMATDQALSCLILYQDPVAAIIRQYNEAHDKDAFVAGLAGALLMRHKQWQSIKTK